MLGGEEKLHFDDDIFKTIIKEHYILTFAKLRREAGEWRGDDDEMRYIYIIMLN